MRYMIIFRSFGESKKRTKKVSQKIGEQAVALLSQGKHLVIDREFFNASDIESIQKINSENFGFDFADQQSRMELESPEEVKYLKETNSLQISSPQNALN